MAEFSPISENFTPIEEVDWNGALTTPAAGYVDTNVSESFQPDRSNEPYTFPSVRGSAISVQDKLANISFVEGSAGEMSASIAYIRYWSRKGTQQKTVVGSAATDNVVSDPQEELLSQINSLSYGTDLDLSSAIAPVSEATPSRTVLTTPTNTAYQSRPRQPVTTTTTGPRPTPSNRLGSIYSANPGGTAAPAWANPFYTPAAAPDPDGAVWQFLFNPEELQLSSGPDYNRAETWGVADPANSGQPLSWRSNKNRKLTFGKVLLHGYTFGKRVDSLENGLQQLSQARDGENGADGPPVLEFVWGQRVFGPCVIQNIQVREKAWDKGLLVNAEVSFDLEQVPEWTINDGFVDVLRPGRQSTINDPSLPGRTGTAENKGGDEKKEPKDEKGGGGGKSAPGTQESQLKQRQRVCNDAEKLYVDGFLDLVDKIDKNQLPNYNQKGFPDRTRERVNALLNSYIILLRKLQDKVPGSSKINKLYTEKEMKDAINNYYLTDPSSTQKLQAKSRSLVLLKQASVSTGNIAKSYYTSESCKRIPESLERLKTSRASNNERTFLCNNVKENKPCTILAGDVKTNPCNKKIFRCVVKENSTATVYREVK